MSLASIDNFLQNGLPGNGARPSRFLCTVQPPAPFNSLIQTQSKFTYTCKTASIPEMDVGIVNIGFMGRILKYSGDRTWQNWSVSVLLDEDYLTRQMFEQWSNFINDSEENTLSGIPYKGNMSIFHFSQNSPGVGSSGTENVIGQYTLEGVWPTRVGPIQLSWEHQNAISEYNVEFAFDNCVPVNLSGAIPTPFAGGTPL